MPVPPLSLETAGIFPPTSWSLIDAARNPDLQVSREALGRICGKYWHPVFAFLRRKGLDPDQARDSTQDFFTVLLEKDYLAGIERSNGNFRSFLLAAASHFLANQFAAKRTQKRGGGRRILSLQQEDAESVYLRHPSGSLTPEALFEYHWAASLLQSSLLRLRNAYANEDFDVLKPFLTGEDSRGDSTAAAARLGMSPGAFKVAIHRLRKRYRQVLRAEIAETVAEPAQVDGEIRFLLGVLARGAKAL